MRVRSMVGGLLVCLIGCAVTACVQLPTANAGFDYQLGGAYPPPAGVSIVSRDREEAPAPGLYNICYVNGFQAQTEAEGWWLATHPDLVLRDAQGNPIKDPDWDELILDISSPAKRDRLAVIVGDWIAGCRTAGFQAVEVDNLDTYSRSDGRLTQDQAVAYARLLSDRAHASLLAFAQKNSAEIVSRRTEMGADFVVAEECNRWSECDVYTAAYGNQVFVIEYRRADFDKGCRDFPDLSIILRDVQLRPAGTTGYVRDSC
jgi:hypothetical protein